MSEHYPEVETVPEWLLAFMVGDAYGAGFEMRPLSFVTENNDGLAYRVHGLDRNHRPGGTTDDTQMTLAVMKTEFWWRSVDFADEFVAEYKFDPAPGYGGRMRAVLPEAARSVTPGLDLMARCREGIETNLKDTCGAAMRAIPVGLISPFTGEKKFAGYHVMTAAIAQARATHHHPDSIDAAVAVALAAYNGTRTGLTTTMSHLGWADPRFWDPVQWRVGSTSGRMIVEAAFGLLLRHETLHELLVQAVALGGDVDTLAALCLGLGSLLGKTNDLPSKLTDELIRPPGLSRAPTRKFP